MVSGLNLSSGTVDSHCALIGVGTWDSLIVEAGGTEGNVNTVLKTVNNMVPGHRQDLAEY
jgi:hypothetical protein